MDSELKDGFTMITKEKVETLERGWAGHFILCNKCGFRRNTLITYNDIMIVVSSVGLLEIDGEFHTVGAGRYFETMAFHANKNDTRYYDADVGKQIDFESDSAIAELDADDKANEMHETIVKEISDRLVNGETFDTNWI